MMSNLNNISFMILSSKESFMITKEFAMSQDTLNILMMIALSFYLMKFMNFKSLDKTEKENELILTINIVIVSLAMICNCPYKFLIFMEMSMFPLIFYILKTAKNQDKKEALMFMMFINMLGSIPFMVFSYKKMSETTSFYAETKTNSLSMTVFSMLLFIAKTPVFLFHFWLTKAHVSASGCCSMILASVMIKLGTMGMYKFVKSEMLSVLMKYISSYSTISSFMLSVMMIRFFDFKTLIATSSILHMGMMVPMISLNTSMSKLGCIMMMSSHGLISCFLFYLITVMYEKMENRSLNIISSIESQSKLTYLMMMTMLFLNMGIPPIMNFISETLFVGAMVLMKMKLNTVIMCLTLITSMMFTMQASSILSMKKENTQVKKGKDMSSFMNFVFYVPWVATLILYL